MPPTYQPINHPKYVMPDYFSITPDMLDYQTMREIKALAKRHTEFLILYNKLKQDYNDWLFDQRNDNRIKVKYLKPKIKKKDDENG